MTGVYLGEKHCDLTHGPSQATISTDAPKDNAGRGEAFSPTDLVGAALGSCVLTTMAIFAERHEISLKGSTFTVTKEMNNNPRTIARLTLMVHLPAVVDEKNRKILEDVALKCPVKRSLHPDVQLPIEFQWDL